MKHLSSRPIDGKCQHPSEQQLRRAIGQDTKPGKATRTLWVIVCRKCGEKLPK